MKKLILILVAIFAVSVNVSAQQEFLGKTKSAVEQYLRDIDLPDGMSIVRDKSPNGEEVIAMEADIMRFSITFDKNDTPKSMEIECRDYDYKIGKHKLMETTEKYCKSNIDWRKFERKKGGYFEGEFYGRNDDGHLVKWKLVVEGIYVRLIYLIDSPSDKEEVVVKKSVKEPVIDIVVERAERDYYFQGTDVSLTKEEMDDEIYDHPEEEPTFPSGNKEITAWLAKNIQYPPVAAEQGIQGKIILRFVVEKDGSIGEVQILQSVESSLDKEAVRVVKKMPRWTPAKNKGVSVRSWFNLPTTFRLELEDDKQKK
ncbi:hypothetical protein AGMMS49965_13350 [Bacteroidia bacterium]|nr:hypothetical protein AGMMS49965_13350 [Bacteroidia bacterium]